MGGGGIRRGGAGIGRGGRRGEGGMLCGGGGEGQEFLGMTVGIDGNHGCDKIVTTPAPLFLNYIGSKWYRWAPCIV